MVTRNSDMRSICYVIIGGLFLFISALSAETKKVCVSGNWEIANITPEEARNKAIEEAKIYALQKAGISELLSVVNTGTVSDRLNSFVSSSYSEYSGEIISYKVLKEQILTEGKHIFYMVDIEASVRIRKNKRDLEFDAYIEGISETPYKDGEHILFNIRPTKDCYLHMVWFDEKGDGNIVYPNQSEPSQILKADQQTFFPITQDYKIKKETQEPVESISLVFILTKKDVPYTRKVTLEDFHHWVLSIPSELRILKFYTLYII